MARRSRKGRVQSATRESVEPSSGNVFADLRLPDARELDTKVRLAIRINRAIGRLRLSRADVSQRLSLKAPQVTALKAYRLDEFSVEALTRFVREMSRRGSGPSSVTARECAERRAALGGAEPGLRRAYRRRTRRTR